MKCAELTEVNSLLFDRVRLAIMAALATSKEPVEFVALVERLELTRGNLSTHMQKLEQAGLVEVLKKFVEKKPCTSYRCTPDGLREVEEYLIKIESILVAARKGRIE